MLAIGLHYYDMWCRGNGDDLNLTVHFFIKGKKPFPKLYGFSTVRATDKHSQEYCKARVFVDFHFYTQDYEYLGLNIRKNCWSVRLCSVLWERFPKQIRSEMKWNPKYYFYWIFADYIRNDKRVWIWVWNTIVFYRNLFVCTSVRQEFWRLWWHTSRCLCWCLMRSVVPNINNKFEFIFRKAFIFIT